MNLILTCYSIVIYEYVVTILSVLVTLPCVMLRDILSYSLLVSIKRSFVLLLKLLEGEVTNLHPNSV
jgi:hypothetical protein